MTRVRVRGIYATALTQLLLEGGHDVVQASGPIQSRFDAELETVDADVSVEMTSDRQGVGISGAHEHVDDVLELVGSVGIDTLAWPDRAARGAVFNAVVERTTGGGAILALADDHEGYLAFDDADTYVDEGDHVRVQVTDPAPCWADHRAQCSTDLEVGSGGLASLVRGVDGLVASAPDGAAGHELARTTEMLPTDVPENWGVRWHRGANEATLDALNDALSGAVSRANELEEAISDAPTPADQAPFRLAAPESTVWAWFGREARFALDDARREVTPTMTGHHRVKAGSSAASTAVDFHEGVAEQPGERGFAFGAVTDAFGPTEGDLVAIEHGKPDGRLITIGRGEVTDRDLEKGRVTVRREMSPGGTYDALDIERTRGDVATTRFTEGNWWYPTVYRSEDGTVKGTYVNVSTPVEVFPDSVRYVDLHVDVVKHADGRVEVVDEDELEDCVSGNLISRELADEALAVTDRIADALQD